MCVFFPLECGTIPKRPYSTLLKSARRSSSLSQHAASDLSANPSLSFIVNSSDSQLDLVGGENGTLHLAPLTLQVDDQQLFNLTTTPPGDKRNTTLFSPLEKEEEEEIGKDEHQCFPILPLARIKHSRDFTDTFLFQVILQFFFCG